MNHQRNCGQGCNSRFFPMVRRVTQALAERLGISRALVVTGFVVGLLVNFPLTALLFLAAWYWERNPEEVERKLEEAVQQLRKLWDSAEEQVGRHKPGKSSATRQTATARGANPDDDLDFADLKAQFEDLERRAGKMESHMTSEEYRINREIQRMRKDEQQPGMA